jgi:hypothetical protein
VVFHAGSFISGNFAGGFHDAVDVVTDALEVTRILGQEVVDGPCAA